MSTATSSAFGLPPAAPSPPSAAADDGSAGRWRLAAGDAKVQRLFGHAVIALGLNVVCASLLAFEVRQGVMAPRPAAVLALLMVGGALAFLALVRAAPGAGVPLRSIAVGQCLHSMGCIVAAYGLAGPQRGAALMVLVLIMLFTAFSMRHRQAQAMCAFAVGLLGLTMLWKMHTDPARYPPAEEFVHFVLAATLLAAAALLAGQLSDMRRRLQQQKAELALALARIEALATRDALTQLVNRGHMIEVLGRESRRHARAVAPMSVALIDIDHFKRINDTHGHAAGDAVLRAFAEVGQQAVRASDVLARWGGEEFLLLMPDTEADEARRVLQRLRERTAALRLPDVDADLRVTFSAGVAAVLAPEPVVLTVERADRAMYAAKAGGRDRVVTAT